MSELIIFSGKLKGQRLILPAQRDVVVGRDEDCHMRIASSLVSRKHCVLRACPDGIHIRDLDSQNGTYVNDVAISDSFVMKPGDVLRIGAALFQAPLAVHLSTRSPDAEQKTKFLDDESSSVISDQENTIRPSVPDTTVIKGRQPPTAATAGGGEKPVAASSAPVPKHPRYPSPPRSIKEQAAEIIQRHWDMLRNKPH